MICLVALLLLLFASWLMVRQMASDAGKELRSADSQNGSCVLKTYTRRYSAIGYAALQCHRTRGAYRIAVRQQLLLPGL